MFNLPSASQLVILGTGCIVGMLYYKQLVLQGQLNELRDHYLRSLHALQQARDEAMDAPAAAPKRVAPRLSQQGYDIDMHPLDMHPLEAPTAAAAAPAQEATYPPMPMDEPMDPEESATGLMLERMKQDQMKKLSRMQR
jgi:hypothetical protein